MRALIITSGFFSSLKRAVRDLYSAEAVADILPGRRGAGSLFATDTTSPDLVAIGEPPGFELMTSGPVHRVEYVSNGYGRLFNDAGALGEPLAEACPAISGKDWAEMFDRAHLAGERQSAQRLPAGGAGDNPTFVMDVVCVPLFETGGGVGGVFCQVFNVAAPAGEYTSADSR